MALFSWLLSGCTSNTATLNIVVFNYTESAAFDLVIGESFVQGYHMEKSGGGKVVGGVPVPIGETTVSWYYDTYPDDPRPKSYFARKVDVVVPRPEKGDRFLGVHIYPGDVVEFSLTNGITWKKKQGEPYDHDWLVKDPLYRGWDKE